MTARCHPISQSLAEEMLQVVARALCDRPADTVPQRDSRTRQMVHSTLGFEPRDAVEYMLSTLVFGHFQMILDAMHDVFQGQADAMKAKSRASIVALDRSMIAFIKELRIVRRRPLATEAPEARQASQPRVTPPASVTPSPATEPAKPMTPNRAAEAVTVTPPGVVSATTRPVASAGVPPASEHRPVTRAQDGGLLVEQGASGKAGATVTPPASQWPIDDDEGTVEQHLAAFPAAMAAAVETLAEAQAFDDATEAAATTRGRVPPLPLNEKSFSGSL